ncbi:hypothetical protein F4558_002999 [Micromonospora profundi]|uniref:outer membrane protein assembly factor BamB family protein n=1 Tax=Micromonospora profundi TaxID=1420889 RepID=UPI00143CA974|nr:PQQ-binding-like beta-propeller repeat protein [Micromonospora profundi]NJC13173.1 hypothetical protein [Micromonospora profundi]
MLAHVNGPGRLNVIANVQGRGFDVVSSVLQGGNDMSTLQAHDVDGTPMGKLSPGSFTGECGAADVITHGRRLIITLLIKTVPAAGITQATHSLEMNAWDATSGAQVWSATPVEPSPESLSCQAYDGNLQGVSTTLDGSWGVMLWPPQRFAIDLRNGQLYPRDDLLGTIGNYVTVGTDHTVYDGKPNTVNMTIPGEWKILGTFKAGNSELGTLDLARTGSMASTGSSYTGSSGQRTLSTPDGTTIVSLVGNSSKGVPDAIKAYRLPSAQPLWALKTPKYFTDSIHAINSSIVLVNRARTGAANDSVEYMAVDVRTGKVVWSQKIAGLSTCLLTARQILIRVNGQFATLDAATGKQLSYQDGASSCPDIVAPGLTGVGRDEMDVVQLMSP